MSFRRNVAVVLGAVLLSGGVLAGAAPASSATGSGYATWTSSGTGGAFTGTVTLPVGFPAATFRSDSRGAVAISTSAVQPAASPFGRVFGASTGRQYVGLRPAGGAGTVSTTTYTFAGPTPAGTWGIALGDIDAEALTISATDAAGSPVPAADLGFQSAASALGGADTLTVASTATGYSVRDEQCPAVPGRCDTSGATAWFRPAVPLSTLTVTSAYVSGAPVYQTWFATLVRSISGTVTVPAGVTLPAPLEVELSDASGTVVANTPVATDGTYLFDGLAARPDYSVAVDPDSLPTGATASDPVPVDTSVADAAGIDLAITAPVVPPPSPSASPSPTTSPTATPSPTASPTPTTSAAPSPSVTASPTASAGPIVPSPGRTHPSTHASNRPVLAATGSAASALLPVALLLTLTGAATVILSRPRRRMAHADD